jgi:hypothetical protein
LRVRAPDPVLVLFDGVRNVHSFGHHGLLLTQ